MDGAVDHECCCVEHFVLATADHLAFLVDLNQIGGLDQRESEAEWVNPECVGLDRVADCDVACDTFVESIFSEDTEGGCQTAFQVGPLFVLIFEGWWALTDVSIK